MPGRLDIHLKISICAVRIEEDTHEKYSVEAIGS